MRSHGNECLGGARNLLKPWMMICLMNMLPANATQRTGRSSC